ncbi:hypothetical protein DFH09DRAFT_943717 [Mycena vulgaris]|nr:hypothetical protein DFH09DRAFT_943717 [Mycena vulgaris]
MPELQVVEDEDEEEDDDYGLAESESDDEIITAEDVPSSPAPSPFRFNRPIFVIDPPHPRRCLNYLRSYGGGTDSPAPIDVTTTDDEDSFNSDGGSAHYNPTDWIGAGKTWSNSLPSAVKRARNTARCVPHNARLAVIPDDKMPVSDMLFEALPNPSTDTRPASFSTEPANIVESTTHHWCYTLFTAIPFLPTLRGSFNDAWISGSKSICFPHLPGKFYPLWTENFLSEIKSFVSKRSRWQSATEWLKGLQLPQDEPHTSLLNRAWRVLGRLPWDGVVPGLSCAVHLTMPDLASFLGTDWLNDEMINAGADWILRRLEPWSRVRIINCLFIQSLANACTAAGGGSYNPAQFSPIDKAILAGLVDNLYFPLHVSGNHWTLLKIDLVAKTISYADSLGALGRSPPAEELALVRWWLKSLLPDSPSFSLVPPDFPYPRQTDGHSCGIIVLSTLAMILLDYDAWSPDHAECHRLQWFLNLSETLASPGETLDDVDFFLDPLPPDSAVPLPSDSIFPVSPSNSAGPGPAPVTSEDWTIEIDRNVNVDGRYDAPARSDDDWVSSGDYYVSDGDDSDSDSPASKTRRRRRRRVRNDDGPKAGSSWARQKELKTLAKDPEFKANTTRLGTFRNQVLLDDQLAEFDDSDVRRVRCSRCTTWIVMRVLYDLVRWRQHRDTAKCKKCAGSSTQSLFSLGFTKLPTTTSSSTTVSIPPPRCTIPLPCPGLTRESDTEIATYIARTSVTGGGAPSRVRLAMDLFAVKYSDLEASQQRMILRREVTLQKWKIGRSVGAVFSASCLRDVPTPDGAEPQPCTECQNLYKLHGFKVAIHRPMPAEIAMKYVPVAYRDKELGTLYLRYQGVRDLIELDDGRSPWLKFAQGCVDGSYSSDTLTGMVKALVLKSARVKQGKCMKNLKYSPEFDQFCNTLASASPHAYTKFQKTFGGPGLRAMRAKRAKLPRFQPDLSAFNVATAAEIIQKLKYDGPVALSWDDTSLEACISVYQESKDVCLILGGADGAIRVTEGDAGDDFDALFESANRKKADKLRVWMLSIPLPKIPPILVAAVARGSSTKAEDLSQMHFKLAELLHEHDIHPISLSSDGAEVERAAQRMIAESAPSYHIYVIPNPTPRCEITLKIPLYYGYHPTIILQHSKHALKTARNQILTGARVLIIGFFMVLYTYIRDLAMNAAGPLYRRDVEKVDKQDDRAAARLFSGNTLEFQLNTYPGQHGVSIYLFVLGELVDAWQNRSISHRDRTKMVLRARFFLMAWRSHTESHPDHDVKTQFISRESYDIFLTICDGLLALIVAYRKYFPTYPLLPWLHSTEVCEHFFGMLRQLKKDFNYADVLYLERKLRVLMMGAFGNLSSDEQANETAGGYHHTYFNADDLDTAVLMQYPTDEEFVNASKYAFDEASQLLKVLGISADLMLRKYRAPEPVARRPAPASAQPTSRPPQTIMELLALYESVPLKSSKDEEALEACELALVAEDLDKSLAIAALPDSTEDSLEELRLNIEITLESLSKVSSADTQYKKYYALPLTLGNSLNNLILVAERMRHQPKSSAKAVRQHGRVSVSMMRRNAAAVPVGPSLRESLLARLAATVSRAETGSKTTGVDRYVRHTGTYGGSGVPANMRVQNKATVKSVAASKFTTARAKAFAAVQWIHENMHLANITDYNPLKPDDFVIVLKNGAVPQVLLSAVMTMYTKNTNHDWIPTATSVGTPSYIYVSVYRQFAGAIFSSMACGILSCPTVLQIPRTHILFSLASFTKITRQAVPTAEGYPHMLATLCPSSLELLQKLRQSQTALVAAVLHLAQLMKNNDGPPAGMDDQVEEVEEQEDAEMAGRF